jgi:glycosyltransferase involved in cell wall biosynthesis
MIVRICSHPAGFIGTARKQMKMSKEARRRAEELSWSNIDRQYESFYAVILKKKRESHEL